MSAPADSKAPPVVASTADAGEALAASFGARFGAT